MRYLQTALITAMAALPFTVVAAERPTAHVGGPYPADIVATAQPSHTFGMTIMKPMFDADVSLLTSVEREVILSKKGVTKSVIPIPLDDAVRFAAALLKASEWCSTLDSERVAGSKTVDSWSWKALPVTYIGENIPKTMGMNISVVAEAKGPCVVKLDGKGAYPMSFVSYMPPESASRIVEDITNIPSVAETLDQLQAKKQATLDQLQ